ncbi:FecR family protein [Woeseia oceani]|uniref:FecR protein domain-containing protein n=1 Tax=Woeseia oceani TaxID=1548547 RepID=A0A193LCX7_9GAMM|nr:FecR domain-containing protein [Woeseia oceani]ANO50249.1 hypothetical protein BA177_02565 [Woeseia oceani]
MTNLDGWIGRNIPDVILDDAAAWMARLDSDSCNDADRSMFARWLDADQRHQWAFEELSEVWARLHTLVDVRPLLDEQNVVRLPVNNHGALSAQSRQDEVRSDWTALAASMLVVLGVIVHVLTGTPTASYSTTAGEAMVMSLDDGTRVELNARSKIDVRITDRARLVTLDDGEAVFQVSKDARPFAVRSPYGSVVALGTTFAVRTTPQLMRVSVLDGTVAVKTSPSQPLLTEHDSSNLPTLVAGAVLLEAGDKLDVTGDRVERQAIVETALDRDLSWRDGYVEFLEEPLGTVIADMQRYLSINVHIAGSELAALPVSGRFSTNGADDFLQHIQSNPAIIVERTDPRWVILRPSAIIAKN